MAYDPKYYELKNQDIIKGGHLMVFVEGEPIAFATNHSLSKTRNTQEVTSKDHGDTTAVLPTTMTWQVTCENLYSLDGYSKLNYAFNQGVTVELYFGETTYNQDVNQRSIVIDDTSTLTNTAIYNWGATGFGESGKALITQLDVTAAAGENATFSATFQGSGDLNVVKNYDNNNIAAQGIYGPTGAYVQSIQSAGFTVPMHAPTGTIQPTGAVQAGYVDEMSAFSGNA